ncbi:MAG: hypothetical protein GY953_06095 [bacterium]|nr:hypothetical protein [bacterium]
MSVLGDPVWKENDRLADRLLDVAGRPPELDLDLSESAETAGGFLRNADGVVTHTEVNDRHGVGVLLRRLFRGQTKIVTIRSTDHYDGQHDFEGVGLRVAHADSTREATFRAVLNEVRGHTLKRILCTPYYADDVRTAIALEEIFRVPLCTYLLDDQNICASGIPDSLMRELFSLSSLLLAVSPEMVTAYNQKYPFKIWYMPPVVTAEHVLGRPRMPESLTAEPYTGVIVGNIWGQRWLDRLRGTVRDSGVTLRWHTYDHLRFIEADRTQLARDSILVPDGAPLDENELVEMLRRMPFAVIPSGDLTDADDRNFIAQLSLPSRIPFMLATSHVPMIVLGSSKTPAARFVHSHQIGTACGYDRQEFRKAVEWISTADVNQKMRENAAAIASQFSDTSALDWIWRSLAAGKPVDSRYEELMPAETPDVAHLVNQP